MLTKESIRQEILHRRLSLDPKQVDEWSQVIQRSVLCSEVYLKAQRIALYSPFRNEVKTEEIFKRAIAEHKAVFFPQWNPRDRAIRFFQVADEESLQPTTWGTREPQAGDTEPLAGGTDLAFDLIIIPGVVFDLEANRLGYGYGGYDRFLRRVQSTLSTSPQPSPCQGEGVAGFSPSLQRRGLGGGPLWGIAF